MSTLRQEFKRKQARDAVQKAQKIARIQQMQRSRGVGGAEFSHEPSSSHNAGYISFGTGPSSSSTMGDLFTGQGVSPSSGGVFTGQGIPPSSGGVFTGQGVPPSSGGVFTRQGVPPSGGVFTGQGVPPSSGGVFTGQGVPPSSGGVFTGQGVPPSSGGVFTGRGVPPSSRDLFTGQDPPPLSRGVLIGGPTFNISAQEQTLAQGGPGQGDFSLPPYGQHHAQHHGQHHGQHLDQHHSQHHSQHHAQHHGQHHAQHHTQHHAQHHASGQESGIINPFFKAVTTRTSGLFNQPVAQSYNMPHSSTQGGQTNTKRFTNADSQSSTTLHVKGIPDELNSYKLLVNHFKDFGTVVDLNCVPEKRYATVQFRTHAEATKAKKLGSVIQTVPVQLFWHKARVSYGGGVRGRGIGRGYLEPDSSVAASSDSFMSARSADRVSEIGFQPYTPPESSLSGSDRTVTTGSVFSRQEVGFEQEEDRPRDPRKKNVFDRLGTLPDVVAPVQQSRERTAVGEPHQRDEGYDNRNMAMLTRRGPQGDADYVPGQEDSEQMANDDEEDRNMAALTTREPRLEQIDRSKEMDTVAKYVTHPYNLRSIHQAERELVSQGHVGIGEDSGSSAARDLSLQSAMMMASLPLPPHPGGVTAKEFYDALEERDKEMRERREEASSSSVIRGTCPDMCPEKERYLREFQRRLSRFEVLPGSDQQVDHSLAVKEYSKSAADQDRPLPHELRPTSGLQMTMDYLIVEIVNLYGRVPVGDWFDFLWDRMRSVRKDITLQQLCSPQTADLLEKCARFHILSSYILSGVDDLSVYDPAINHEHLMKCIQSLIETYRELRLQGINCDNEGEICCYDILLHITSGDVLRRVTKYSPVVLNTPQVKFAIKVAVAMETNNFVRFFKLCKSTTFLNSCIMYRYLYKLRSSALVLLNNTHSSGKRTSAPMDLTVLCRMIGMQANQLLVFCQSHGLEVDGNSVYFQKGSLTQPDAWEASMEPDLVDAKCTTSYGEMVYGGPLPTLRSHTPQCSFGQHGTPKAKASFQVGSEFLEASLNDLIENVIVEDLSVICDEELSTLFVREAVLEEAWSLILVGVVSEECILISREEHDSALKEREFQQNVLDQVSLEAVHSLIAAVVARGVEDITSEVYSETLMSQAREVALSMVHGCLLEDVLSSELEVVVRDVVSAAKKERKLHLEGLRKRVTVEAQRRYWRQWVRFLELRRHVLKEEESFPVCGSVFSLEDQVVALGTHMDTHTAPHVLQTARALLQHNLDVASEESKRIRESLGSSLDLEQLLAEHFLKRFQSCAWHSPTVGWSLLVFRGGSHFTQEQLLSWRWLMLKLGQSKDCLNPTCTNEVVALSRTCWERRCGQGRMESTTSLKNYHFTLCVKAYCAEVFDVSLERIKGSSAVMIVLPWQPSHQTNMDFLRSCHSFLKSLETNLLSFPSLPVVAVVEREELKELLLEVLNKEYLTFQGIEVKVLPVGVVSIPNQPLTPVTESLTWLVENSTAVDLIGTDLDGFLQDGLVNMFMSEVIRDDRIRTRCGASPQGFGAITSLYNSVLDHLANMATNKSLQVISYPCEELAATRESVPGFNWNASVCLDQLKSTIERYKLPSVEPLTPQETSVEPLTPQKTSAEPLTPQETSVEPLTPQETSVEPLTPQETSVEPLTPQETSVEPLTPQETSVEPLTPQECMTFLEKWLTSLRSSNPHSLLTRVGDIMKRWQEVWCDPVGHTHIGVWFSPVGHAHPVSLPWAKIIVACAHHCIYEADPAIKVWLPWKHLKEGKSAFQLPLLWKRALADTAKAQDNHFSFRKEQKMAARSLELLAKRKISPSMVTSDLKLAVDDGDMPIASTFLVTQPPKRLMTTPPDAGSRPIPFPVRTKRPHSASATVHTSLQDDVESLVKEMKRARHQTALLDAKLQTLLDTV